MNTPPKAIIFDFLGTLVKMRPPKLLCSAEILARLCHTYQLAIITGGRRSEVINILQALKIDEYFNPTHIITKTDSPYHKPNPQLIELMKQRIGTKEVLYVGDSLKDAQMAKAALVPFVYIGKKKLGIIQTTDINQIENFVSKIQFK